MIAVNSVQMGNTPRAVLRGVDCQDKGLMNEKINETGLHWLRISISRQYLKRLKRYCSVFFGENSTDGRGLWSYDTRHSWLNGASLNFDSDRDRADKVHQGKATLDVPGRALDEMAGDDLHSFVIGLRIFQPSCTRCDIFFDDYRRTITPTDLQGIVKRQDYSGYRKAQFKQRYERKQLIHDEVDFGTRGDNGSGKYLRIYDKVLESEDRQNCIRWETEFSKDRAHEVFDKLSQTENLRAFTTLCGSLLGGAINFIYRTGDIHLSRLSVYGFWQKIKDTLGVLAIRIRKEFTDITGTFRWVHRQVVPTLACLRNMFIDDIDFLNWVSDITSDGELRMSQRQVNLAKANKRKLRYKYAEATSYG